MLDASHLQNKMSEAEQIIGGREGEGVLEKGFQDIYIFTLKHHQVSAAYHFHTTAIWTYQYMETAFLPHGQFWVIFTQILLGHNN